LAGISDEPKAKVPRLTETSLTPSTSKDASSTPKSSYGISKYFDKISEEDQAEAGVLLTKVKILKL
jgi:hypothetical protein